MEQVIKQAITHQRENGISDHQFSQMIGVNQSTWSRLRRGITQPRVGTIEKIEVVTSRPSILNRVVALFKRVPGK